MQVLAPGETGDPSGTAWTEAGEIDHRGHDAGVRLVDYLDDEVGRIVAKIRELLAANSFASADVVDSNGLDKARTPSVTYRNQLRLSLKPLTDS